MEESSTPTIAGDIDVSNSEGELLPGTTANFQGSHFDSRANGIKEIFISDYSDIGYYMGIDNVELNAYAKNSPSPVPEPPSLLLLLTGCVAGAGLLWTACWRVAKA